LARRHPEYFENMKHWDFLEDTYKGGREWFEKHVYQNLKESDSEFEKRKKRAYRFNHTREVVDLIDKYIFKSAVARKIDDASDPIKAFWKSTTLSGLNIDQFMRVASKGASTFGKIWVFVDSTKSGEVLSRADEKKAGARCYAYTVKPQDILDLGFDDSGEATWILIREFVRDDKDAITSSGNVSQQFRLWTTDSWHVFAIRNKDKSADANPIVYNPGVSTPGQAAPSGSVSAQDEEVVLISEGTHKLKRIPGFPLDNVIGECRYDAPALIADIAYLDRAVANYLSNLDVIIQDQTFSQLAMPAQGLLPGSDGYDALMEMGTKRIFTYDGEGGARPEYLSPDPKQAGVIVTVINKIINEIYHSLGMGGERTKQDNAVGIDNSSGVAKAYDFERLNSLLVTKSASLQNAENELTELVEAWNGVMDDEEDLVKYADTFDVRTLTDEFTVSERLALIDAPREVRQEQMSQLIDKLFPAVSTQKLKEMIDGLKNWPITQQDLLNVQATMTGNPPTKFPAKGVVKSVPAATPAPTAKKPAGTSRQGQVTKNTGQ
jgi:hypothetical protein